MKNEGAMVDAINGVADGLNNVARAIRQLGTANANTDMGALENLALEIKNGFEKLSDAVADVDARAIVDALDSLKKNLGNHIELHADRTGRAL